MFTIKEITDIDTWESFLKKHEEANFLQSWQWGKFNEKLGKIVIRNGFYKDNKLVGVSLAIVEPARRGRYMTIPGGPIIDWADSQLVSIWKETVKTLAKSERCGFIRVRSQLLESESSKNLFNKLGFRPAPMHLHAELTNQIDLRKSETDLLSQMRKNTRYEIKKAEKLGIVVKTSTSPSDIKQFYDLQLSTAKKQKFVPFSYQYLYEQFNVFVKNNQALLFSAYYEEKLLSQAFIIFYGSEAVYHYGASTEINRDYPGAYAIQWVAIKEAKTRGMTRYNLWGVAPADNPSHRFFSLSTFKRGFGGEEISYLHAHDLIVSPLSYFVNFSIETARKKLRRV